MLLTSRYNSSRGYNTDCHFCLFLMVSNTRKKLLLGSSPRWLSLTPGGSGLLHFPCCFPETGRVSSPVVLLPKPAPPTPSPSSSSRAQSRTCPLPAMASASFLRKMWAGPAPRPGAAVGRRNGEEGIQRQCQQEDLALEGKGQTDDKRVTGSEHECLSQWLPQSKRKVREIYMHETQKMPSCMSFAQYSVQG